MNYIYYFRNYKDEIVYVGKTNDLKRRMKEHFIKGHLDKECYLETSSIMFAEIGNSKYDTEIFETLMINKYKPKYNKEKKFNEEASKTIFNLTDLDFKQLFVYFLDDKIYITKEFRYPCFNEGETIKQRCENLLNYNIGNLKHKLGIYKYLTPTIYNKHRYIYKTVEKLYKLIKQDIYYDESNLDEPISDTGDLDLAYIAFNVDILDKMNFSAKTLLLLEHCGFIFRIDDLLYAVPLHTENVIKAFDLLYKK